MTTTSSITFRIDNDEIESLRRLAQEEQISINALVCRVLRSYLEWESFAVKADLAPMQKCILRDLFNIASDEELEEIATKAADNLNDTLLMMYGKFDLDAALQFTASRAKRSGFTLRKFDDDNSNDEYGQRTRSNMMDEYRAKQWVLQHDMGAKWSTFSKFHIERLMNNLGYAAEIEETSDNLLVVKIQEPDIEAK